MAGAATNRVRTGLILLIIAVGIGLPVVLFAVKPLLSLMLR